MDSESYLSVLNEEQRAAVIHDGLSGSSPDTLSAQDIASAAISLDDDDVSQPACDIKTSGLTQKSSALLILAGAGSGKTRVITTKIAYLISEKHVDPSSILAVTFTKKAANEMRERAIALEPRAEYAKIRTFHSWGAYFLRSHAGEANIVSNFTVYDDDDMATLVSKAVPSLTRPQAVQAAKRISLAKDYCLTPDSENLYTITEDPAFADVYAAYQRRLRETGNVDFGDLIMLPYIVLRDNEAVRKDIHRRYRVIMVDEYQDSNVAQFLLLQQLSGVNENTGTYVCVVGDDDQSIYKFRGAEIQNILNFQNQFPGTELIRLQTNYRSTSEILACADSVVQNNSGRLGKTLVAARGKGKKPALVFRPTQDDETQFCADIISLQHQKGVPYSDWAILYRTNAQSLGFETEFLHRHIPYTLVGSLKFYEREEIKDALAWISFIANRRDEISFRRIVNKPARGIGNTTQDKIILASTGREITEGCKDVKLPGRARKAMDDFCAIADEAAFMLETGLSSEKSDSKDKKLSEFISAIIEKSGLEEYHKDQDDIAGTQKLANLQELENSAVLYPCTMDGLLSFLDSIQLDRLLEAADEDTESSDKVTLITLHNTKGLEFPRVIITGMERGIFPREDKTGAELEEERRLFYVGITRAQNELYFTSCGLRRLYGRTNYMSPSIFLSELGKENIRILGDSSEFNALAGSGGNAAEADPIAKKYHVGACVYHDDYGHGQIVRANVSDDGEYVISVSFETGGVRKFIPKYQSKSLLIEDNI